MACPFCDSPASSKGGAADRSEKRQRRRRSSAGRLRREKSGEGAEATSVSYMACGSDHPSYSLVRSQTGQDAVTPNRDGQVRNRVSHLTVVVRSRRRPDRPTTADSDS